MPAPTTIASNFSSIMMRSFLQWRMVLAANRYPLRRTMS